MPEQARVIVQSWLDSPSHRENMLNPASTEVGIGAVIGENSITDSEWFEGVILVGQNFGFC